MLGRGRELGGLGYNRAGHSPGSSRALPMSAACRAVPSPLPTRRTCCRGIPKRHCRC